MSKAGERLIESAEQASGFAGGKADMLKRQRLTLLRGYDELICLNHLPGVERFWYQIETVKKVLRDFGGRVLLGDEVGLGKTIEACMAAKEFMLRGLVRSVLILTPASLVSQWQEELASKFALSFTTTDEVNAARHPEFWQAERIIASLNLASACTAKPVRGLSYPWSQPCELHVHWIDGQAFLVREPESPARLVFVYVAALHAGPWLCPCRHRFDSLNLATHLRKGEGRRRHKQRPDRSVNRY